MPQGGIDGGLVNSANPIMWMYHRLQVERFAKEYSYDDSGLERSEDGLFPILTANPRRTARFSIHDSRMARLTLATIAIVIEFWRWDGIQKVRAINRCERINFQFGFDNF